MTPQTALATREQNNQISTTRSSDIDIFRLGQAFAKSGYFQDARDEAQAVVKIIYGQELGISPAASMSGIHIISGKPILSATALAGLIKARRPGYDYKVLELTDDVCRLEFYESGAVVGLSEFSLKDAKNAELVGGKNVNWKKYPKNMLFARAISNGARLYCPDIFVGSPIYTPDELDAQVDESGAIILDKTADGATPVKVTQPEPGLEKKMRESEISGHGKPGHRGINAPPIEPKQVDRLTEDIPNMPRAQLFDDKRDIELIRELMGEFDDVTLENRDRTREKIRRLLIQSGVNPAASLKRFDTFTDAGDIKTALEKTRELNARTILDNKRKTILDTTDTETNANWALAPEATLDWLEKTVGYKSTNGASFDLWSASEGELDAILAELVELGNL